MPTALAAIIYEATAVLVHRLLLLSSKTCYRACEPTLLCRPTNAAMPGTHMYVIHDDQDHAATAAVSSTTTAAAASTKATDLLSSGVLQVHCLLPHLHSRWCRDGKQARQAVVTATELGVQSPPWPVPANTQPACALYWGAAADVQSHHGNQTGY
jgi:hypothetical protein